VCVRVIVTCVFTSLRVVGPLRGVRAKRRRWLQVGRVSAAFHNAPRRQLTFPVLGLLWFTTMNTKDKTMEVKSAKKQSCFARKTVRKRPTLVLNSTFESAIGTSRKYTQIFVFPRLQKVSLCFPKVSRVSQNIYSFLPLHEVKHFLGSMICVCVCVCVCVSPTLRDKGADSQPT